MLPLNTCMSCKLACWILSYVDKCKHACLNVNMQKILTCKKLATCRNSQHAKMSTFETCMLTIKHARYFATMLTCVFFKHACFDACFECNMSKKRMSTYSPLFWCAHSTALFPAHDEDFASFYVSTTNVYRSIVLLLFLQKQKSRYSETTLDKVSRWTGTRWYRSGDVNATSWKRSSSA